MEFIELDAVDLGIVHALDLDGRAPFARIADVLGVSDATVVRHYRRMRASGALRVVPITDTRRTGQSAWVLRVRCAPNAVDAVTQGLGRRPDVSWVQVLAAETEVMCVARPKGPDVRGDELARQLGRVAGVIGLETHCLLRTFVGGPMTWQGQNIGLTADQADALLRAAPQVSRDGPPPAWVDGDRELFAALAKDGRTSYAELARACGTSESAARRRVELLRATGVLYFEVETDPANLGYGLCVFMWMSVRPSALEAVAEVVRADGRVVFAAATTGRANFLLSVMCRDTGDLYDFLARSLGSVDGITNVETTPIVDTIKREGPMRSARRRG
ncbi:Lrp/AsnC family transcriptional regulator [Embleya sp. NBC_00896]|uniref:Lrp/AsnC family transcriptional regulator n=1 Tax=Embleya sp. NBC_00896 TaxID=2975961 RepID=UPI00386EDBC8|nr:Lrp/AsnC family transcriptional regulator [Embleya sp. NBC_00896]